MRKELDPVYKVIGQNIANLRKELHLSQAELAKQVGCQQNLIASYEIARRRIPVVTLIKIAKVLNTNVSSIVPEDKQPIKPGPKSKLEKRLEYIKTLPESKQQKILGLLESALEIVS